jgi:hypothetical protein
MLGSVLSFWVWPAPADALADGMVEATADDAGTEAGVEGELELLQADSVSVETAMAASAAAVTRVFMGLLVGSDGWMVAASPSTPEGTLRMVARRRAQAP